MNLRRAYSLVGDRAVNDLGNIADIGKQNIFN